VILLGLKVGFFGGTILFYAFYSHRRNQAPVA
jgi:hypothetical protein